MHFGEFSWVAYPPGMEIKTLFRVHHKLVVGRVQLRFLPGVPQMHIVGLPDAKLKEAAIKIKTSLRACGYRWPRGQQVIVNLRAPVGRSSSDGAELAIAMGVLKLSRQLPKEFDHAVNEKVWFGELGLNGEVIAPQDVIRAISVVDDGELVSGHVEANCEGNWWELESLSDLRLQRREGKIDWAKRWVRPELPGFGYSEYQRELLKVAVVTGANVILAGPHGTGKSTFAQAFVAVKSPLDSERVRDRVRLFGQSGWDEKWIPALAPHHSITPQAMIGGGSPIRAGVITRAHHGILIMDEFLEFHQEVLESLREPLERGEIHLARCADNLVLPARVQLIATTNLCPCGKMRPEYNGGCSRTLGSCRSTSQRLSGPLLDRFDLLVFTHEWEKGERRELSGILEEITAAEAEYRSLLDQAWEIPEEYSSSGLNHRRQQSMLRIAKGLAAVRGLKKLSRAGWSEVHSWVIKPEDHLAKLFA